MSSKVKTTKQETKTEKSDVEPVNSSECTEVALSLKDLSSMIIDHPSVKQGIIILITDDDDLTELKGHFYDNAALLSGIMKDYKARIFSEIFSDAEG